MELVKIDVIGAQATQAVLERCYDVTPVKVVVAAAYGPACKRGAGNLGREHNLVALGRCCNPVANVSLCTAAVLGRPRGGRVHLGCVEKVDTAVKRVVDLGVGFGLTVLRAPGHGSEADRANADIRTAEWSVIDGRHVDVPVI